MLNLFFVLLVRNRQLSSIADFVQDEEALKIAINTQSLGMA